MNANVILFLGENAETSPAIEYLIDLMRTGVSESFSLYYKDRLALHYMIARAYLHSAPSLAIVGERVVGDILARQQANGSLAHALEAALAASALLTFAPPTPTLAGIIEFLLHAQRDDGSWPAHPFYSGPTEFWGSEELTTGLCIEALARHRKAQELSMGAR